MTDSAHSTPSERPWLVIVHYGDPAASRRALASGLQTDIAMPHVVVDHMGDWPEEPDGVVLRPGTNLGFAAGVNLGARHAVAAGATHVWLLNNDAEPAPYAVNRLLATARRLAAPGVVGSVEVEGSDADADNAASALAPALPAAVRGLVVSDDRTRRYDFVSGFSMLISAEVFRSVGYFEERFFHYFEDVEFSIRAARGGGPVVLDRQSRIRHVRGSSLGRESRQATYYFFRNRLLLASMYRRAPRLWVLLTADPKNGLAPLVSRRRIRNRDWEFLVGAWLGTMDGLRGRTGRRDLRRTSGPRVRTTR